eukprot:tig00000448_g851.t1
MSFQSFVAVPLSSAAPAAALSCAGVRLRAAAPVISAGAAGVSRSVRSRIGREFTAERGAVLVVCESSKQPEEPEAKPRVDWDRAWSSFSRSTSPDAEPAEPAAPAPTEDEQTPEERLRAARARADEVKKSRESRTFSREAPRIMDYNEIGGRLFSVSVVCFCVGAPVSLAQTDICISQAWSNPDALLLGMLGTILLLMFYLSAGAEIRERSRMVQLDSAAVELQRQAPAPDRR